MSMETRQDAQVLALAALYQAVSQVRSIAAEGTWSAEQAEACLRGLLVPLDRTLAAVYGGEKALEAGLRTLHMQLSQPQDMELTRYAVTVLHLERKLMKRSDMLGTLREGLDRARDQADYFSVVHESVVARLADLYQETVSQLTPRILVKGRREWLDDSARAARIRALLLAALRAGTFWRQAGGGRLKLIFGRGRLQQIAHRMIDRLATQD